MKSKTQIIASIIALVLVTAAGAARVAAQHTHDHGATEWKKGMVRLNTTVWIGDVRLKSGMYHVRHVMEGDKHRLVFRSVALPAGKEFPMWEGNEVARSECRVEPATKSVRNTKVILTKTSGGIRRIQEIQIAGEKVRHILLLNPPTV